MASGHRRVIYQNNPLVEVSCSVEFEPMLELELSPVDFQREVRTDFPLYKREVEPDGIEHFFYSSDGTGRVILTRDGLMFSTTTYERWEEFIPLWSRLVSALVGCYGVEVFSCLKLRYVDVIDRAELGLSQCPWSELLEAPFLGLAGQYDVSSWLHRVMLRFHDTGCVAYMEFGLIWSEDDPSERFVLDVEHVYPNSFETSERRDVEERLRVHTSRVFSSALTDKTRDALRPEPLDSVGG